MKLLIFIVFSTVSIYSLAQKNCTGYEELNRKRHKIDGGTYGHPYTTFDTKNGISFNEIIIRIRKKLISESSDSIQSPVFLTYQTLYNSANTSINTNNDDGLINTTGGSNNYSQLAQWAKTMPLYF